MTAELAILNREAVVLAADRTLTMVESAIDPTTNQPVDRIREVRHDALTKLFVISDDPPIGLMVYDQLSFAGLTWDKIVASYRQLSLPPFDTVVKHAAMFLVFLQQTIQLVPCPEDSLRGTGLVIAGFANKRKYPELTNLYVWDTSRRVVEYDWSFRPTITISPTHGADGRGFAQMTMFPSFVEGVHPGFKQGVSGRMTDLVCNSIGRLIISLLGDIPDLTSSQVIAIARTIHQTNSKIVEEIPQLINATSALHRQQIYSMFEGMTKADLAAAAYRLVRLQAMESRATSSIGTVGEHVDVVILTKHGWERYIP